MARLVVDANVCVGCGHCAQVAPKVFELGADGKSHVMRGAERVVADVPGKGTLKNEKGGTKEQIQKAIDECPVEAISWK